MKASYRGDNDDYDDNDERIIYCHICDENQMHVETVDYIKCLGCGLKCYHDDDYRGDNE